MGCLWTRKMASLAVLAPSWVVVLWLKRICLSIRTHSSFQRLWFCPWNLLSLFTDEIIVLWLGSLDVLCLQGIVGSKCLISEFCWCFASVDEAIAFLSWNVVEWVHGICLSLFDIVMNFSFVDVFGVEARNCRGCLISGESFWGRLDVRCDLIFSIYGFSSLFKSICKGFPTSYTLNILSLENSTSIAMPSLMNLGS